MNKKGFFNRYLTAFVLLIFALALFIVGAVLRTRIGTFVQTYTENQTKLQAKSFALLISEKLNTELENLEYIAGQLESDLDNMDDLMPRFRNEEGIQQGLLSIDGDALYGESLDFSRFDGIQSSFRGKNTVTYVENEGLLFTCPVFNGANIRYVLYRLCPEEYLGHFATEVYDDQGKLCVTTRDGHVVVPFYNSSPADEAWYAGEDIQRGYESMHLEMEVSIAVARTFSTDRGDILLFEAEIPGTDYLVSGYVPKSVAAEGVENLTLLVVWVFGLLMLLVMIGAFYLTRASIKIRESDALREAKSAAEKASRAKSEFLANMSHEIRTPINAVLGMNEMIIRESRDDAVLTYASNVKAAGNSLLGIVNDILDFSKIEAGKIEIIPVEYSLSSVINDIVNMIQSRADNKGLKLILDFDPGLPRKLFGDEGRIKQIIINLLTNAVKYTEKGSVTFSMGFAEAEGDADSIMLKVYVKDTGIGIKKEDMTKIFSEFERIEEKRNRNIEGTGLGMSITKNLLSMMDSSLEMESVYGKGSTFGFAVKQKVVDREPLGAYEATLKEQLSVREQYREKFTAPKARVLVVDDNEMNLMVFRSLIKKTLIGIDTAISGNEGIRLSSETKYDMIFLDHMMPEKDGIETLNEIRTDAGNPNLNTPMICLTANAISGAREEYLAAGFDDYLTKPIDTGHLEAMLMKYLPDELIEAPGNDDVEDGPASDPSEVPEELAPLKDQAAIDVMRGLKNCGSAEAYLDTLRVYYESIDALLEELDRFLSEEDYGNYTIKVHALKSSLRIIGADELGKVAQGLETAGKERDHDHIGKHHEGFTSGCKALKNPLSLIFRENENEEDKPVASLSLMSGLYDEMRVAAEEMNCDILDLIFMQMSKYTVPENEAVKWEKLRKAADVFDYEGIIKLLDTAEDGSEND